MLKLTANPSQTMKIEQFKEMDYFALEKYGLPIELMMENAGLQLANVIAMHSNLGDKVLIGVGNGNNGGGGLVAARRLSAWGYDVHIDLWDEVRKPLPAKQLERAMAFGASIGWIDNPDIWVDAYLGFSQRRPLPADLEERVNRAKNFKGLLVSLDIPLGFVGEDRYSYFPADIIVTLAAPKKELESIKTARVYVVDLGIPSDVYTNFGKEILPFANNNIIQLCPKVYIHDQVRSVRALHLATRSSNKALDSIGAFIAKYAEELGDAFSKREKSIIVEISNYYKALMGRSAEEIFDLELGQSEFLTIAAAVHGFEDSHKLPNEVLNLEFETAVDLLLEGDYFGLRKMLQNNPSLINVSSQFGHHAQLIHYCTSNAVEIYRQVVPQNLEAILRLLLEFGAKPSNKIPVYGGEFDFFQLFSTSAHPKEAGLKKSIEEVFNT